MMQVIVMCNSAGDQDKKKWRLDCFSHKAALYEREPLSEAHIRSHVPGEEGDSWFLCKDGARAV